MEKEVERLVFKYEQISDARIILSNFSWQQFFGVAEIKREAIEPSDELRFDFYAKFDSRLVRKNRR